MPSCSRPRGCAIAPAAALMSRSSSSVSAPMRLHALGCLLGLACAARPSARFASPATRCSRLTCFLVRVATLLVLARAWRANRRARPALRCVACSASRHDVAQRAHLFLALDHASVHVFVATDAQPFATDPDAVARDDGLAAQQRAPLVERLGQRVDGDDAGQQTQRSPPGLARAPAGGRRRPSARWRRPTRRTKPRRPAGDSSRLGDRIDACRRKLLPGTSRAPSRRRAPSPARRRAAGPGADGRRARSSSATRSPCLAPDRARPAAELAATSSALARPAAAGGRDRRAATSSRSRSRSRCTSLGGLAQLIRRAARRGRESAPAPPATSRGARRLQPWSAATARSAAARAA